MAAIPIAIAVAQNYLTAYKKAGIKFATPTLSDAQSTVSGGFGLVCLINKAPHPNAARVLANWIANKDGLTMYSQTQVQVPVRTDIDPTSWIPKAYLPQPGVTYLDSYGPDYVLAKRAPDSGVLHEAAEVAFAQDKLPVATLTAPPLALRRRWPGPFRLRGLVGHGAPLLWTIVVALPLILLIVNSFNVASASQSTRFGLGNWQQAFADQATVGALLNSLSLALVRTGIAIPIALLMTWLITRTDMPGRSLVELLFWLSIFTPLLPLTIGWILLLDPRFGLVNQALAQIPLLSGLHFNLYGFWGISWVYLASTAIGYPVVLLTPAFRRVGAAIEDAGRLCGATLLQTTLRITFPILAPVIMLVILISLVFSFQGFEVELLLGEPVRFYVYSTRIYDLVTNQPSNVGEATALAFIFVAWLMGLALLYRRLLRGKSYTTVTGSGYAVRPVRLGRWRWVAGGSCLAYFVIALGAPFSLLVVGSFMRLYGFFQVPHPFTTVHWQGLFQDPAFLSGVRNSLLIAVASSLIVVVVYSAIAYVIVRQRTWPARASEMFAWSPWALPGILMSLGFLWMFLLTPARTVLYGSLLGLIVAFIIRGSPLSTQLFKTGLQQIGRELEEAGRMCGASWGRAYRRILLRLLAPTAVTVGLLTFLHTLYDIPTAVLLYSPASRPLSILMLEYSFSGARERGAAIGVLITVFVTIVLLLSRGFGYRLSREQV